MTGTLQGTVTDGQGTTLYRVYVEARDPATGVTFSGRTDFSGDYSIEVDASTYDVTAERLGYADDTAENVVVQDSTTVTVDLTLNQTKKVVGETSATSGVGVLGTGTVGGDQVAVMGELPFGYGLYTPNDLRVDGAVYTDANTWQLRRERTENNRNVEHWASTNATDQSSSGQTIAGGVQHDTGDDYATVSGGFRNEASAYAATIGGGNLNTASGQAATVPGGDSCAATGSRSFACGTQAEANDDYAFVWADRATDDSALSQPFSSDSGMGPTGNNTFSVRATGGVRFGTGVDGNGDIDAGVQVNSGSGSWSTLSARAHKANVRDADVDDVLAGVEELDLARWEYDGQDGVDHLGPMAGQFHEAFGLGDSDQHIATVDADGVALAAIQGLSEQLEKRDERIDELVAENDALLERLRDVEDRLDAVEREGGQLG